ncbi:hypothetical protein EVAR_96023_1 [Eumeta japonica]|uniref:Uncharacterized protein n=1 Tax=Eumeta variegata TaxID=151549 RepID=A0A4C1XHK6_EUMVA|nr:hypothetical protein EVAR_96023_1 [Eumeta japonica]
MDIREESLVCCADLLSRNCIFDRGELMKREWSDGSRSVPPKLSLNAPKATAEAGISYPYSGKIWRRVYRGVCEPPKAPDDDRQLITSGEERSSSDDNELDVTALGGLTTGRSYSDRQRSDDLEG